MDYKSENNNKLNKLMEGLYYYIGYHHVENTAKSLEAIKVDAEKLFIRRNWMIGFAAI